MFPYVTEQKWSEDIKSVNVNDSAERKKNIKYHLRQAFRVNGRMKA